MVLARRKLVDEARGRSRRARLEHARSARPGSGPALPAPNPTRTIDAEFQVIAEDADDVPLDLPFYETEEWDD